MTDPESSNPGPSDFAAEHPVVAKVVGDPTSQESVTLMYGYVGRSTRQGYLRLYGSPDFDGYLEVEVSAVVHREDSPETVPAGRSLLWVKSSALVTAQSRTAGAAVRGATFLTGDIATRNLLALRQLEAQRYALGGGAPTPALPASTPRICPSINDCPVTSVTCGCPTFQPWACAFEPQRYALGGGTPQLPRSAPPYVCPSINDCPLTSVSCNCPTYQPWVCPLPPVV
jgi:hypothetical protein